jgi:hypothetical protein
MATTETLDCVYDSKGNLINIGPWDYVYLPDGNGGQIETNQFPIGARIESKTVQTNEDGSKSVISK